MSKQSIVSLIVIILGMTGLVWWSKSVDNKALNAPPKTQNTVDSSAKEKIDFAEAVGQKAPDFELELIDGTTVKLNDYLGKNVVLFFNEGSMCYPACWSQMAELGNDSRFDP